MNRILTAAWGGAPFRLMVPEGDEGGAGGGAPNPDGGAPGGDPNPPPKTVSFDDHKRALDDLARFKGESRAKDQRLADLEAQMKAITTKKSEDAGDFKGLYEQTKGENDQLKKKLSDFQASVFTNERSRALEAELKRRGLKDGSESVMDLVDLERMPYELTNKGRILVHGVEEVANEIATKYAFAFDQKQPPRVNGGGGSGANLNDDQELTAEYMVSLEKSDPKKYRELFPQYYAQYQKRKK